MKKHLFNIFKTFCIFMFISVLGIFAMSFGLKPFLNILFGMVVAAFSGLGLIFILDFFVNLFVKEKK